MNKRFVIYNTILTFAMGFLVHNLYNWMPCTITTIFPVNESLYEHMKLIYLCPIISSIILFFIFRKKNHKLNNFLFGLMISTVFNIFLFYLVYLPFYRAYGSIMWMTLIIYFITIIISQYLYYLIINMKDNKRLDYISGISLIVLFIILIYFTYHPLHIPFFEDPIHHYYGIK